jgi:hypothetical protein
MKPSQGAAQWFGNRARISRQIPGCSGNRHCHCGRWRQRRLVAVELQPATIIGRLLTRHISEIRSERCAQELGHGVISGSPEGTARSQKNRLLTRKIKRCYAAAVVQTSVRLAKKAVSLPRSGFLCARMR